MDHERRSNLATMKSKLIPVHDRSGIPRFANDAEAAAFWDTRQITDEYLLRYAYPLAHPRVERLRAIVPAREPEQAG